MNRLIITEIRFPGKSGGDMTKLCFAEVTENRKLYNLRVLDENQSLLDGIFVGKVEKIQENLQAAFVRFTPDLNGYLPLSCAYDPVFVNKRSKTEGIGCGDEILVQVVKDAVKTKLPVLSCNLSMKSRFAVLESGGSGIGVSKKIEKETAGRLREEAGEILSEIKDYKIPGIVIRTNAAEVAQEVFTEDLRGLLENYCSLKRRASHMTLYSRAVSPEPAFVQALKTVRFSDFDQLVTDWPDIFKEAAAYYPELEQEGKLRFYEDAKMPLSSLYSLNASASKLVQKQVWLDSGANIIIEQLETLTFIDVNSAKNQTRKEDAAVRINCEAAEEIARQIRLRNLSGMILIDFINMDGDGEKTVIEILKKAIAQDPVRTDFADITKLGLFELTRKKTHKSLREIL